VELIFPRAALPCLHQLKSEVQTLEETQELRMPEGYPDIGKILGAWGQVLLRGKEWRDGSMSVSGGVMTWILYQGEGEEPQLHTVEAWIPFQMRWDLPPTQHDGTIHVIPLLRSVDARTTSARKMVARVTVALLGEAFLQDSCEVCTPPELPEDIHLLQQTYPLLLPREAGEKAFEMEEELTLPASCPKIEKMIRFSLQPELIDRKVLSGKLVFRGAAILHILYQSGDGKLCNWDFEIPFSRYTELDDLYEQEARSTVSLVLTSLELQEENEGILRLKAGLTGQYIIYDKTVLQIGEDAYSNLRDVHLAQESAELPAVLQLQQSTVTTRCDKPVDGHIIDAAFYPDQPRQQRNGSGVSVQLSGQFHILGEKEGQLFGATYPCSAEMNLPLDENVKLCITALPSGKLETAGGLCGDVLVESVSASSRGMQMLSGLEMEPLREENPNRPSLVLRRADGESLWQIAKGTGSTVDAIVQANRLEGEPDPSRLLLIPIK